MLNRTMNFNIPNRVCEYLDEPRDCIYKGRENIHTCCQEECPLMVLSMREGNYIREVGVLGGRLREQANKMGLKETDLVYIVTSSTSGNPLPIYELEKVDGSPSEFLEKKVLETSKAKLSPEEKRKRAIAFTKVIDDIINDPDFEDKLDQMPRDMFEISEEELKRRFTM